MEQLPGRRGEGIFGRRFAADGSPLTSEFQVNSYTVGNQDDPVLAVDPSGTTTVVWRRYGESIQAQRYDSAGAAIGTEFKVNSVDPLTFGGLTRAIAAGSTAALIVWDSFSTEITGRLLDGTGAPQGAQFTIATTTAIRLSDPDVAVAPNGDFVVVWSRDEPEYESELFGRRVASTGALLGTEFQVNENPGGAEYDPKVEMQSDGDFVVAWNTYFGAYSNRIEARRFDSGATPLGDEFLVSSGGYKLDPALAVGPDDGFVVAWSEECGYYCYDDVQLRRFAADGSALGGKVDVNQGQEYRQEKPALAINGGGRLLLTWTDEQIGTGNGEELIGQMFVTAVTTPICSGGGPAGNAKLKISKLGVPPGDEGVSIKGELPFAPGVPAVFNPALDGAQLLLEDTGAGDAVLFELSHRTIAIPPNPGCTADDGWSVNGAGTSFVYKNKSGMLPPLCAAGSAGGLTLVKFKDLRANRGFIKFKVKLKKANLPAVVGPVRTSLVAGASAVASGAGDCGVYDAASCTIGPTKLTCP